jgi:hypothetical protein
MEFFHSIMCRVVPPSSALPMVTCSPVRTLLFVLLAGDLSTNNWLVAILAWGEGWHNNHHALAASAAHGLEWWEIDLTYGVIKILEAFGLAWDIELATEKQRAAKRKQPM